MWFVFLLLMLCDCVVWLDWRAWRRCETFLSQSCFQTLIFKFLLLNLRERERETVIGIDRQRNGDRIRSKKKNRKTDRYV